MPTTKISTSITQRKRRKRTEWIARLQYYNETGARRETSRSCSGKAEAQRALEQLVQEYEAGGSKLVQARSMTFAQLADWCKVNHYCDAVYNDEGQKLFGVREPKKHHSAINRLVKAFGPKRLHEITVADLRAYRKARLATVKIATCNRELSTMRAMLNDAIVNDWLVRSPFSKAKKGELIPVSLETKRDRTLTADEEARLLAQCETEKRRHLKALLIAGIDSGCRQGELLALRWSDIDFQANSFTVRSYKGKAMKTRTVPLTKRLRQALLDLRAKPSKSAFRKLKNGERPDSTLVFGITSNVKRSFAQARKDAGVADLHFHDTRHCAGTALSQGGMSLALVGEILGHSDPKTTLRYINSNQETVNAARDILERKASG